MKICYILENFYPFIGGAEKLFYNIVFGMASNKHQVRVITSKIPYSKKKDIIGNVNIFRYKWFQFFGHSIPKYNDILPHIQWADIVHTAAYSTAPYALKAAQKFHKPCIITVYEYLNNKWYWVENPISAFMLKLHERLAVKRNYTFWHSISKATTTDLIAAEVNQKRIITIYPGVEVQKYSIKKNIHQIFNINKNIFTFLYFGRLGKTKGVDILLKAIKIIDKSLKNNIKFCFLVNNPNHIKQKAKKMNINHRISVHEHVEKTILYNCIQTTNCVIVPSITEGFGYTTAETCYLKTPIIASNAGSIPEIISGRYLLFKNQEPTDLSKKIIKAFKNQYKRSKLKKFSIETMVSQIENIYIKSINNI